MSLLRVSLIHRHGSRGPGESELSVWAADAPVHCNWSDDELDLLNDKGHTMCEYLGDWFNKQYTPRFPGLSSPPRWRCSKSGRGKESGFDFRKGFNSSVTDESNVMGDALEFDRSADYYFRPWKIYTNESKKVKKCIGASKKWATKSAEHLDFLKRIFTSVQCKPQLLENPPMLLWSTTYLIALRDCETFATTQDVDKNKLSLLIPDPQDWARILELACWVWSERFLNSGYELEMGCNMMIDLLDDLLRSKDDEKKHCMSVFSGHDYTLLGLFGLLGVCDSIESSIGFSSFALFELYDGIPPESALSGIDASQDGEDKDMYVRVKCNFNPFFDKENRVVTEETMQDANMVVLKDYRVVDLKKHLESVRSARDEKNLLHAEGTPTATPLSRLKSSADGHGETFYFSKHSDPDSSYCNSTVNSPICDFDIPRIDDCLDLITNPCSEDND